MGFKLVDYKCKDCGRLSEKFTEFVEKTIECDCGGEAKRQVSAPNVGKFGKKFRPPYSPTP